VCFFGQVVFDGTSRLFPSGKIPPFFRSCILVGPLVFVRPGPGRPLFSIFDSAYAPFSFFGRLADFYSSFSVREGALRLAWLSRFFFPFRPAAPTPTFPQLLIPFLLFLTAETDCGPIRRVAMEIFVQAPLVLFERPGLLFFTR